MTEPPIHLSALQRRTLDNDELTADLLRLFRLHVPPARARLLVSAAAGDLTAARSAVHQLKSSAATIAADRLAGLLRAAETELLTASITATLAMLPAIGLEIDACLEQIDELLRH